MKEDLYFSTYYYISIFSELISLEPQNLVFSDGAAFPSSLRWNRGLGGAEAEKRLWWDLFSWKTAFLMENVLQAFYNDYPSPSTARGKEGSFLHLYKVNRVEFLDLTSAKVLGYTKTVASSSFALILASWNFQQFTQLRLMCFFHIMLLLLCSKWEYLYWNCVSICLSFQILGAILPCKLTSLIGPKKSLIFRVSRFFIVYLF